MYFHCSSPLFLKDCTRMYSYRSVVYHINCNLPNSSLYSDGWKRSIWVSLTILRAGTLSLHSSLKYWIPKMITSVCLDLIFHREWGDQNVTLHRLHPDELNEQTLLKFLFGLNESGANESLRFRRGVHLFEQFAAQDWMLSQIACTISSYTGALPLEFLQPARVSEVNSISSLKCLVFSNMTKSWEEWNYVTTVPKQEVFILPLVSEVVVFYRLEKEMCHVF